jgi:hypothetical protein
MLHLRETAVQTSEREDWTFRELDGRRIGVGSESWIAQVFGVHMVQSEGWIQIGPKDQPRLSVVVHIWKNTTIAQIAMALAKWAQRPADERPLVISATAIQAH